MNFWIRTHWRDNYLVWNPEDFHNITHLFLPPSYIWLPDFGLWNSRGDVYNEQHYKFSKVRITSDGVVYWTPGGEAQINCPLDTKKFPFDTQTCMMLLEPDKYLHCQENFQAVGESSYVRWNMHGVWKVAHSWSESDVMNYTTGQFSQLQTFIILQRKPAYFITYLIAPCIMLGFLNLFVFVLPPNSGEKISLGITIIMSYFIFLVIIVENLPQNSDNIPIFAIYLCLMILLSALSVISATTILCVINCQPRNKFLTCLKTIVNGLHMKRQIHQSELWGNVFLRRSQHAGPGLQGILNLRTVHRCEEERYLVGKSLNRCMLVIFSTCFCLLTVAFFLLILE